MSALRHGRSCHDTIAGLAQPGEQVVHVLLWLQHEPFEGAGDSRGGFKQASDGVAAQACQHDAFDLAWTQDIQSLTLPAIDVWQGRSQAGVRAGSPLGGDYVQTPRTQLPGELTVAGAHVRYRRGLWRDRACHST